MLSIVLDGVSTPIDFVTSDQHVGHTNISRLAGRGFDNSVSTAGMDAALLTRWNDVVGDKDVVLVLGDVALGKITDSLAVWTKFRGRKLLVPGNHDRVSSVEKPARRERFAPLYEEAGFEILPEEVLLSADVGDGVPRPVVASHYPFVADSHAEARHAELRPKDEGGLLIHGHTHSHLATDDVNMPRQFHVGVDAHGYAPVPAHVIVEWVQRH